MMKKSLITLFTLLMIFSCRSNNSYKSTEDDMWKLGWRMIMNSQEGNYATANEQFDSLLNSSEEMGVQFLLNGLKCKSEIGLVSEMEHILNSQTKELLIELCEREFLKEYRSCEGLPGEIVENPNLQMELMEMHVNDQAVRGNVMQDVILKYNIDTTSISRGIEIVDKSNRIRLKEIISEYGFPTRRLVGRVAMDGIFLIIQHSDRDKEWQSAQLENIKLAVENGDMVGRSYAYLYDRIKRNKGEKQLYGTQFSNVDPVSRTVELAPTENIEELNERRRKIGMMPIEMYKQFMLRNL